LNTYSQYGDNELLSLLSQDDTVAFTEIYNRFWQRLFVITFNRLQERQSAEDIIHDVFAGLWANRHHASIASLENYLATAVKYSVLTRIRKKIRERDYADEHANEAQLIPLHAEDPYHYKQVLNLVNQEVERLPERCKLIFKYSRQQGMRVKEIANELQLSPKTVEKQLSKAIRQLRLAARSLLQSMLTLFF
jgi:RNA polymerase sigma-70 factor (family 1)